MSETVYLTKAGLERMRAELQEMKTTGRKEIAEAISEAREKGDLRENAEYDAAKNAQGMLETEIAILESKIANAKIIDESQLDTSKALILAKVRLKNHNVGKEMSYQLVPAEEANFKEGKISVDSPVGKGLLGKEVGDIAEVKVPAGIMKLEILEISYDHA